MSADIEIIKSSPELLLEVLGLTKAGSHQPCPCGSSDALSIKKRQEQWKFKCFKCGAQGSVIDALIIFKKLKLSAALEECRKRLGIERGVTPAVADGVEMLRPVQESRPSQSEPPGISQRFPELNHELAEKIIGRAHENLLKSETLQKRWMIDKRGISRDVVERYRLGFVSGQRSSCWILPITHSNGKLLAIKGHFEIAPPVPLGKKPAKGFWSTKISLNGQSAVRTFWPHPHEQVPASCHSFNADPSFWISKLPSNSPVHADWTLKLGIFQQNLAADTNPPITPAEFDAHQHEFCFHQAWDVMADQIQSVVTNLHPSLACEIDSAVDDWIFLCPGELKALALISAGARATSFTHGENTIPTVEEFGCFRGRRVAIFYDDDLPRIDKNTGKICVTGRTWASRIVPRLKAAGALEVRIFTGGRE